MLDGHKHRMMGADAWEASPFLSDTNLKGETKCRKLNTKEKQKMSDDNGIH